MEKVELYVCRDCGQLTYQNDETKVDWDGCCRCGSSNLEYKGLVPDSE
jgi:hypothetical protein